MGSFKGHVLLGTVFLVVELWYAGSALVRFKSNPKSFGVRVWSPVPGFNGKLKYLELYVIAIGGFLDLYIELLYATHLMFFIKGILNPSHFNNFEHSAMLLMFFIFGLVALLSEKTNLLPLTHGALCLIAATAFCAEYLLFHSTTHMGLEGYYHLILVILIGLCILLSVASALAPNSFPCDLCCGIAIALQGLWFYHAAFSLYGPMMPYGCQLKENEISCHSRENQVRGELFANVQLFGLIFGVLVLVVGSYGFITLRCGTSEAASMCTLIEELDRD